MGTDEIRDFDGDGVRFTDARGNPVAAERAKAVQRDATGSVDFAQEGTDQFTGVTNPGAQTLSVSNNYGNVMYDKNVLNLNSGGGTVSLKRDGSTITQVTGFNDGTTVTATGSPRTTVGKWTANLTVTGIGGTVDSFYTSDDLNTFGAPGSDKRTITLSGTGSSIDVQADLSFAASSLTVGIYLNSTGNTITKISGSPPPTGVFSEATTGTFTNSNIIFKVTGVTGSVDTQSAKLISGGATATATLTASRNQLTTVS